MHICATTSLDTLPHFIRGSTFHDNTAALCMLHVLCERYQALMRLRDNLNEMSWGGIFHFTFSQYSVF